jgi:hypothetical protein
MTQKQWTWLATRQREISNDEGFRFKFTNDWDDDGLPIVVVEKRDPRGVFRYSHPFGFNDNIPESVKEELRGLWEITRQIELKYKTVIEQDKMGIL